MAGNEESDTEAFEAVFGKERPGRVCCYGRNITKTSLKRKSEINALKKAHNEEVSTLRNDFEDKIGRLQNAFKTLMQHCNPQINMESIEDLLGLSHGDANSDPKESGPQMHSSTSAHAPCILKRQSITEDDDEDNGASDEIHEDDLNDEDEISDEFQEDDISDDDIGDDLQDDDLSDEEEDDVDDNELDKFK
ncbi:pheromone-processing carboxypeptidase KEX1-like [Vicia villosa]|uniref:pheromone-processing carboxypeptidase KEX1-like n=1 Tax=Vicia villosa TaxID=3911 RepID=UPI00273B7748|nr:pheromone-processing carboxypeptidase KEX1-like [Vicia villosa]